MKKFFAAMMFALIFFGGNFVEAAAPFTAEQSEKIISMTAEISSATEKNLPVDEMTFRRKFNDFIINFILELNAGNDAAEMERLLTINDTNISVREEGSVFMKNFFDRIAIVGISDGGNFRALNLFATQLNSRDDALINALILQAFVKGITPDFDSTSLLRASKKNPTAPVIRDGVRYYISRDENLNIVTAVAD